MITDPADIEDAVTVTRATGAGSVVFAQALDSRAEGLGFEWPSVRPVSGATTSLARTAMDPRQMGLQANRGLDAGGRRTHVVDHEQGIVGGRRRARRCPQPTATMPTR